MKHILTFVDFITKVKLVVGSTTGHSTATFVAGVSGNVWRGARIIASSLF